jgi:hypothetical protein
VSGPPTLSAATVTAFTDLTADLSVTTDRGSGTLYYVIDTSATPPSAAQVKAGQGSGGGAAASSGSQAVSVAGAQTKSGASGLAENTAYYAYFMQETAPGQSSVAASSTFTTYYTASQAIFTAFTTPPVTARKTVINTCVGSLKTAGIWTLLDCLYFMAAADAQAALINWKNPGTFNLIAVNSPTFTADRGFTGDGATSRLRTQFTPSANGANFTLNDASLWVFSLTAAANAANAIGNSSVSPRSFVTPRNASNQIACSVNDGTSSVVATASGLGLVGASRVNSTTKRAWRNGAQVGSDFPITSTALPTQEQWLLAANATSFSTYQEAGAAFAASLTGLESSFNTAITTYMQAVGAA